MIWFYYNSTKEVRWWVVFVGGWISGFVFEVYGRGVGVEKDKEKSCPGDRIFLYLFPPISRPGLRRDTMSLFEYFFGERVF
jgi:hypothetical protein